MHLPCSSFFGALFPPGHYPPGLCQANPWRGQSLLFWSPGSWLHTGCCSKDPEFHWCPGPGQEVPGTTWSTGGSLWAPGALLCSEVMEHKQPKAVGSPPWSCLEAPRCGAGRSALGVPAGARLGSLHPEGPINPNTLWFITYTEKRHRDNGLQPKKLGCILCLIKTTLSVT